MFDWQTIAVAAVILAACLYAGRRGWARLRSFRAEGGAGGGASASCATGCGSCGGADEARAVGATPQAKVLVQIGGRTTGDSTRRRVG